MLAGRDQAVTRELHAFAMTDSARDVLRLMAMRAGEDKSLAELVKAETKALAQRERGRLGVTPTGSPQGSPQVPRRATNAAIAAPTLGVPQALSAPALTVPVVTSAPPSRQESGASTA